MTIFLTIIAVIVIFSMLVLIHELGHFIAARRAGIRVLEFGIGFPPRLFKKKFGETVYSLNAIPFGGFVKLYGEDSTGAAVLKDKRSFAHKSAWIRTKVIVAGVLMNFLLAIVLLTVGFTFGIEPLLVSEKDVISHISSGTVVVRPGIFATGFSDSAKVSGLEVGDEIKTIDGKPVSQLSDAQVFQRGKAIKDVDLTVRRANGAVQRIHLPLVGDDKDLGVRLKPRTEFPRLAVLEVKNGSASQRAGIIPGDVILKMNGLDIYDVDDYFAALSLNNETKIQIFRNGDLFDFSITFEETGLVVISDVIENFAASKAGFKSGDVLISIDGKPVTTSDEAREVIKTRGQQPLVYEISRGGARMNITAQTGADNLLGVSLSRAASFRNQELSVYQKPILTSIISIGKVKYGPLDAFSQAISETRRLTVLTVEAFGNTLRSLVEKREVPADIGGPVQIAYYTHTFVQEGFFALIRFTALLSLSLAVINILPIPALDGGRLLFIVIEVITRRRVNARLENLVHGLGFVLLIGLIILVTYSDITKLLL